MSFVEAMRQMTALLYMEGNVMTSMPKPVDVGDVKDLLERHSSDAASSVPDVKDLYPCMLTMCGSAGTCIAVCPLVSISCQSRFLLGHNTESRIRIPPHAV